MAPGEEVEQRSRTPEDMDARKVQTPCNATTAAAQQQKRRDDDRKKRLQAIKSRAPSVSGSRARGGPPQAGPKGRAAGHATSRASRPGLQNPKKRPVAAEELDGEIIKRLQQVMSTVVPITAAAAAADMRRSLLDAETVEDEEDVAEPGNQPLSSREPLTSDRPTAAFVEEDILETSLPALWVDDGRIAQPESVYNPSPSTHNGRNDKALRQSIAELHVLVDAKIQNLMQQRHGTSRIPAAPVMVRPISANTKARSRIPAMCAQLATDKPSFPVDRHPMGRRDRYGTPEEEEEEDLPQSPPEEDPADAQAGETECVGRPESAPVFQRECADLSLMASSSGTDDSRSFWSRSCSQRLMESPGGSLGYRDSTEIGLLNLREAAAQRSIAGEAQMSEFRDKHRTLTQADPLTTSTDQLLSRFMAGAQLRGAEDDEASDSDAYSEDFCYSDDDFDECDLDLSTRAQALRGSLQQLQALLTDDTDPNRAASAGTCPAESIPASLNGTLSAFQLIQACNALQDTWEGSM